ncbi:MAG: DUF4292 domain-containing protein [Bacteroidota bacterium]
MYRRYWRLCFWLLVGSSCWQACRPGLQKSPSSSDRLVQPLEFEYLTLSATLRYYNATQHTSTAYVKFRIQKNQCIWFSVVGLWGAEIMRGMLTPQSVTILDHLQKTYRVYDYATLQTLWPGPWDYAVVQALLLGEVVQDYTAQEVLQAHFQQAVIQQQKGAWILQHLVNSTQGKVEKLVATGRPGRLIAVYHQFKPCQGGLLSKQATFSWYPYTGPTTPATTVKLARVKAQWPQKPLKFPFVIPAHYEKK